jgi:predicted HAD superfamily phosphohydrolase
MQEVYNHTQELFNRIFPIVETLFKSNNLYNIKLDKEEMIEMLIDLFRRLSPEEMKAIKETELIDRID